MLDHYFDRSISEISNFSAILTGLCPVSFINKHICWLYHNKPPWRPFCPLSINFTLTSSFHMPPADLFIVEVTSPWMAVVPWCLTGASWHWAQLDAPEVMKWLSCLSHPATGVNVADVGDNHRVCLCKQRDCGRCCQVTKGQVQPIQSSLTCPTKFGDFVDFDLENWVWF